MGDFDPKKVAIFTAVFVIAVAVVIAVVIRQPIVILFGIGVFALDYFLRLRPELQKTAGKKRKSR